MSPLPSITFPSPVNAHILNGLVEIIGFANTSFPEQCSMLRGPVRIGFLKGADCNFLLHFENGRLSAKNAGGSRGSDHHHSKAYRCPLSRIKYPWIRYKRVDLNHLLRSEKNRSAAGASWRCTKSGNHSSTVYGATCPLEGYILRQDDLLQHATICSGDGNIGAARTEGVAICEREEERAGCAGAGRIRIGFVVGAKNNPNGSTCIRSTNSQRSNI